MKTRGQKTRSIQLRVTPEMYKGLYSLACDSGRSIPEVIRRQFEKILKRK